MIWKLFAFFLLVDLVYELGRQGLGWYISRADQRQNQKRRERIEDALSKRGLTAEQAAGLPDHGEVPDYEAKTVVISRQTREQRLAPQLAEMKRLYGWSTAQALKEIDDRRLAYGMPEDRVIAETILPHSNDATRTPLFRLDT